MLIDIDYKNFQLDEHRSKYRISQKAVKETKQAPATIFMIADKAD